MTTQTEPVRKRDFVIGLLRTNPGLDLAGVNSAWGKAKGQGEISATTVRNARRAIEPPPRSPELETTVPGAGRKTSSVAYAAPSPVDQAAVFEQIARLKMVFDSLDTISATVLSLGIECSDLIVAINQASSECRAELFKLIHSLKVVKKGG